MVFIPQLVSIINHEINFILTNFSDYTILKMNYYILEAQQFIEIVSDRDTFSNVISYHGTSMAIVMICGKIQFLKKMLALIYFKTIFIINYKDL